MHKYKITYLIGKIDANANPPEFVKVIFPAFNGETVNLSETECIVEFAEHQTPVSISPLIKVELLQDN
jgi:hypothetical protein